MRIHTRTVFTVFAMLKQQALPNIYAANHFCKGVRGTREEKTRPIQLLTMEKESREVSDGPVLHNHRTGPVVGR